MTPAESVLEKLCDHFDDELERQENMLALCIAQGEAARAHDLEFLEAKTAAMMALQQEAIDAEAERLSLVCQVVDAYDLPVEKQTLSDLIRIAPEPWKRRLGEFQTKMREVIESVRKVSQENAGLMRRSQRVVNDALNTVMRFNPAGGGRYDASGHAEPVFAARAAFVDHRG